MEELNEQERDWVKSLLADPKHETALVNRLKSGQAPDQIVSILKTYARDAKETDARTYARRILQAAGVGWD